MGALAFPGVLWARIPHGRLTTIVATVAVGTVLAGGASLIPGGGGGVVVTPPGDGEANIWVDTTGGSCVDYSSPVTYPNDGTECSTLAAAVAAAEPGDEILIRTGTYPFETLAYRSNLQNLSPGCDPYGEWGSASTTNCIHIQPDGGTVTIRGLTNNASSLWIQGEDPGRCSSVASCNARTYNFKITNQDLIGNPPAGAATDANCNCKSVNFVAAKPPTTSNTSTRPDHVIVDSLDVDTVSIYSSSNVLARRLDVGPMWFDTPNRGSSTGSGPDVPRIWYTGSGAGPPEDVVWDGNFVHEMNRTYWCDVNNACHNDGLFINSGDRITIRNTGFSQIAGEVLFFQNFGQPDNISDVTVENSWFGCKVNSYPDSPSTARTTCGQGTPFSISACGTGGCVNFLVRFNSWYGIDSASESNWTNGRFIGNVGRQPGSSDPICTANTWTYNALWTNTGGSDCGATNGNSGSSSQTSIVQSVTAGSENFNLNGAAGSTIADNRVTPTSSDYSLTTDVDGQSRTAGSRDAGIDER